MSRLLKSTRAVGSMTMISRVFGLLRDVILARAFGAGSGFDVFIVVFRIPNFLRRLFAEGGFSQAFVPILAEYKETRSKEEVQALLDQTVATLGTALLIVSAIGVFGAPLLITLFAPGFLEDQDKFHLAAEMLQITFPYILFISLTAFAGAILNTYGHFNVPAFTPVFLNLLMIMAAIWLAPYFAPERQVVALAWGVFIAGIVQMAYQVPYLLRLGFMPRPRWNGDRAGILRVFMLMIPTLFAVSVTQINLLVDTMMASYLPEGSISWLYYSDRLVEFPLGVFGVALATVILPNLSAEHAKGAAEDFGKILAWAVALVFLVSLPATLGLIILSKPLITTLFQYSEFSPNDMLMSSKSLSAYAVGLPGFILVKVLSSAFFSRQDTATPVKIGVVALISNIVLILILIGPLAHAGLALATSLAAYINAGLLYLLLQRRGQYKLQKPLLILVLRIVIAVVVMSVTLMLLLPSIDTWLHWNFYQRVIQLVLWVCLGMLVYAVTLWSTGLRPADLGTPA